MTPEQIYEEKIERASKDAFLYDYDTFKDGIEWARQNPAPEVENLAKVCEKAYKAHWLDIQHLELEKALADYEKQRGGE